jgi:hypothetical protein
MSLPKVHEVELICCKKGPLAEAGLTAAAKPTRRRAFMWAMYWDPSLSLHLPPNTFIYVFIRRARNHALILRSCSGLYQGPGVGMADQSLF